MTTLEERVSHLEGRYQHLATKADLAELRSDLKADIVPTKIGQIQAKTKILEHKNRMLRRWAVGLTVATNPAVLSSIFIDLYFT